MKDYEYKEMKPYKGFEVYKAWEVNEDGKRIGKACYIVADDDDYIGEEYESIAQAHRFIDSVV